MYNGGSLTWGVWRWGRKQVARTFRLKPVDAALKAGQLWWSCHFTNGGSSVVELPFHQWGSSVAGLPFHQ